MRTNFHFVNEEARKTWLNVISKNENDDYGLPILQAIEYVMIYLDDERNQINGNLINEANRKLKLGLSGFQAEIAGEVIRNVHVRGEAFYSKMTNDLFIREDNER